MCQNQKLRTSRQSNGQSSTQTECGFTGLVAVDSFKQTLFLTVDSDPQAEETWQRFSCNDTVRCTSPDFLKSLALMFQDKPAGQYLVQVELAIHMTTLDFEPTEVPEVDSELEAEANASLYASHATQEVCLNTAGAGQTEAAETTDLPWPMQKEGSYKTGGDQTAGVGVVAQVESAEGAEAEFDPEQHF